MSNIKKRKITCYCINLRRAANHITGVYDTLLSSCGLTVNQYSLLINLSRLGESSISDLAAFIGLDRTTLVRTLKPLLNSGMIADNAAVGSRDRRLYVSANGFAALQATRPLWEQAQKQIQDKIGFENAESLSKILELLMD